MDSPRFCLFLPIPSCHLASHTKGPNAAHPAVGMDLAEGKAAGAKDLRIQAGEVHFQGKTEVKGLSNIKNIGQGIVQVRTLPNAKFA